MKTRKIKHIKGAFGLALVLMMVFSLVGCRGVNAESRFSFSVSPMKEKILLNPGDQYSSSLTVYTSAEYDTKIKYKVEVAEFFVDENYNNIFTGCESYCEMADWIKIESPTEGILSPGEKAIIQYTINIDRKGIIAIAKN